jgi:hypothetical protein
LRLPSVISVTVCGGDGKSGVLSPSERTYATTVASVRRVVTAGESEVEAMRDALSHLGPPRISLPVR